MISKKQICGEAFSKVSVDSTRGQQRKGPVEKHESGTMLMSPVTFFGRRVNAVQNEEPQNRADCGIMLYVKGSLYPIHLGHVGRLECRFDPSTAAVAFH